MTQKLVLVAELTAPHGVRGLLRLRSFTTPASKIFDYQNVQTADGTAVSLQPRGDLTKASLLLVALPNVTSIEAAQVWRGVKLFVPRESLPAPSDTEFYVADLIGLQAVDSAGTKLGTISAFYDYGAGLILEVSPGKHLVPFTDAFVPNVNVPGGTITINLPVMVE